MTLGPTADAYVRDGSSAGTNFGTATQLMVKRSKYIAFAQNMHGAGEKALGRNGR